MNSALQAIIDKHIAENFAAFAGLTITGTIPVRQELLNELLTTFLQGSSSPAGNTVASRTTADSRASDSHSDSAASDSAPAISTDALLQLIRRAEIKATEGVITLEFEIAR